MFWKLITALTEINTSLKLLCEAVAEEKIVLHTKDSDSIKWSFENGFLQASWYENISNLVKRDFLKDYFTKEILGDQQTDVVNILVIPSDAKTFTAKCRQCNLPKGSRMHGDYYVIFE